MTGLPIKKASKHYRDTDEKDQMMHAAVMVLPEASKHYWSTNENDQIMHVALIVLPEA